MLTKRKLAQGKVRVTFSMPALEGVRQLNLVGDFNNWSTTETPLKHHADGTWGVALTLDGRHAYEYRYLADGLTWHNDWGADAYVANAFGSENSVVDLAAEAAPAPRRAARRGKTKRA